MAGIHKSSAFGSPHPGLTHRRWNQVLTKGFTNQEISQSGVYPPSTSVVLAPKPCVTQTPQTMLYPSMPLVPGQGTDTTSHIVAISDRQQARLLQRSIYPGLIGEKEGISGKSHSSFGECY